jgi:ABC-type dipeptide/oligopeptide/nickel transport system permease component
MPGQPSMKMWVFIVRRILLVIPVVIGVMTITFALVNSLPIQDRILSAVGPTKSPCGYAPTCAAGVGTCPTNAPGGSCPNPAYNTIVHQLGLDQPVPEQWGRYIVNSLTFNWGMTDPHSNAATFTGTTGGSVPVTTVLGWYLPYTLELAVLALLIILIISIPIGNYAATHRNRPFDQGARVLSFSGFAFPGFLLAVLVLFAVVNLSGGFGVTLCNGTSTTYNEWFGSWPQPNCLIGGINPPWLSPHLSTSPTGFPTIDATYHALTDTGGSTRAQDWSLAWESVRRLILPALVIAFGSIAVLLRFVRNSMLEVLNQDYVRTARAKGVPENRVISYHAGRNSLSLTVTILGLTFAGFIGGFPVIEDVFGIRGVGYLLIQSIYPISSIDYGLLFGSTLLFTFIIVFANLIVDVLYAYLDPRVRLG